MSGVLERLNTGNRKRTYVEMQSKYDSIFPQRHVYETPKKRIRINYEHERYYTKRIREEDDQLILEYYQKHHKMSQYVLDQYCYSALSQLSHNSE